MALGKKSWFSPSKSSRNLFRKNSRQDFFVKFVHLITRQNEKGIRERKHLHTHFEFCRSFPVECGFREIIKMAENGGFCGFWEIMEVINKLRLYSVKIGISLHPNRQVHPASPAFAKIFFRHIRPLSQVFGSREQNKLVFARHKRLVFAR